MNQDHQQIREGPVSDNYIYQRQKRSADLHAKQLSLAGLKRDLQQYRTKNPSDPSRGGSSGYPLWLRVRVMHHVYAFGIDNTFENYSISRSTLYRWNECLFPRRQTGNKQREVLSGRDQLLLSIALFQKPTSTTDDLALFIFSNGGRIYSRQAICKRLKELNVSRKRASIETYAAYSDFNLMKAFWFWNEPIPLGIVGVQRYRMLDIDECHFTLKSIQTKYGFAAKPVRVRDVGHFQKGAGSVNVIIAIEPGNPMIPNHLPGSIKFPRRWFMITRDVHVNQQIFSDFINDICTSIENNPPTESSCGTICLFTELNSSFRH